MSLSPRQKFALATGTLVVVGLAIGIVLIKTQWLFLIGVFFAWIVIGSFLMVRVKCPQCGTSLTYQGKVLILPIYAGYANKRCRSCGYDLSKPTEARP